MHKAKMNTRKRNQQIHHQSARCQHVIIDLSSNQKQQRYKRFENPVDKIDLMAINRTLNWRVGNYRKILKTIIF